MSDRSPSQSTLTYRPDIDGLRAIAVISAVCYHAFPEWMGGGGFTGPEIFFVISGFLISTILFKGLERGNFSFPDFYARRIRRVFPALAVVLLASVLAGWYVLPGDEFKALGKHIAAGAGFASNIVLWGEAGYFDAAAETKILLHLWTLAIEEQFYLVWPLLLWLSWKAKINLLFITLLLLGISFYLNVSQVGTDPVATFYFPQTRFWELLAGAALAWAGVHRSRLNAQSSAGADPATGAGSGRRFFANHARLLADAGSLAGAALLFYGLFAIKATYSFPGYWAVIPVAATIVLIMVGPQALFNRLVLSKPLLVGIGLISYPLYLWHWPLLTFARLMAGEVPGLPVRAGLVLAAVVLAWATYEFIEKPARFGRGLRLKLAALVAAVALTGGAGYYAYARDGFEARSAQSAPQSPHKTRQLVLFNNPFLWLDQRCQPLLEGKEQLICRITSDAPRILVVGDSHAAQLVSDPVETGRDDVALVAAQGCLPFTDIVTVDINDNYADKAKQCGALVAYAHKILDRFPSITHVVLVSRGPLYIESSSFGAVERKSGYRLARSPDDGAEENYARFIEGHVDAIGRFQKTGRQVVLVEDVPELGFNVNDCERRPPQRDLPACSISRAVFDARNARYRAAVAAIAQHFDERLKVFAAYSYFCDDSHCSALRDGVLYYHDDDHLSLKGSRFVFGELLKTLEAKP